MEKIIKFTAGHDCIRFECINKSKKCLPGQGGSHGVHGVTITFILKGDNGAVQFMLYTGWLPQYVEKSLFGARYFNDFKSNAMPVDLGYHSKKPHYEEQSVQTQSCEYCDGQPCYYDGSGLNAYDAMYALVNGGDVALWEFLEQYYQCVFNDGEYPKPCEYSMPLRAAGLGGA